MTCCSQKALRGYFVRSWDENADELASSYWLTKGDLTIEAEGFLIATQDQALNIRAVQQVYSGSANTQCRLCNTQAETVEHLISGCSQLADTQYKLRHDNLTDIFIGVYVASTALKESAIGGSAVLLAL